MTSFRLLLCALLVHFMFLASVFDIYFKSPVLDVTKSHRVDLEEPPARRLVLIVADGLRAEAFLRENVSNAPFLREIAMRHGAWGVVHTRVPTESRPGHVALLAGMYEDPSAITRGWKENPARFDTILNQSRRAWAWGSPDIVPMFAGDALTRPETVVTETYSSQMEDFFGKQELDKLDEWVFDRVESFFRRAKTDEDLQMQLRPNGLILFLHLLGLDSNGHANLPSSPQYVRNLRTVDAGVRKIRDLVDDFWSQDDRTTFIFTADHGMTDWGSHGTGMSHETEVPFVAWGAGIRYPEAATPGGQLPDSGASSIDAVKRSDLMQADVAPLVASLLGIAVPKNSVGRLPHDYLRLHDAGKVEAASAVAKQLFQQVLTAQAIFDKYYFHTPFEEINQKRFDKELEDMKRLMKMGKLDRALKKADDLCDVALRGIEYYDKYYRTQLLVVVSASYVGFMLWTVLAVVKQYTPLILDRSEVKLATRDAKCINLIAALSLPVPLLSTLMQNVPWHYVIYYAVPMVIWWLLATEVLSTKNKWIPAQRHEVIRTLGGVGVVLAVLELMVQTFFDRRMLSLALMATTIWQCSQKRLRKQPQDARSHLKKTFVLLSCCLGAFTFQPAVSQARNNAIVMAASLLSAASFQFALRIFRVKPTNVVSSTITAYLLLSGTCVSLSSIMTEFETLRMLVQGLSWFIFLTGVPLSLLTPPHGVSRLLHVCAALQASYTLLSLSYESLFLLCLNATALTWLTVELKGSGLSSLKEAAMNKRERKVFGWPDLLLSLLFVLYSLVSFFGTGNIASLNSFNPRSIQCLVSVFSPFLMGGILLAKVVTPFLVVACYTYAAQKICGSNSRALFLSAMLFSDFMGMHFFFWVTDTGSWLEIGTSLSHFVIAEATVIFLLLFHVAAGAIFATDVRAKGSPSFNDNLS